MKQSEKNVLSLLTEGISDRAYKIEIMEFNLPRITNLDVIDRMNKKIVRLNEEIDLLNMAIIHIQQKTS